MPDRLTASLLDLLAVPLPGAVRSLRRRLYLPNPDKLLSLLDEEGLRRVREIHAPGCSDEELRNTRKPIKYLDARRQIERNLRRAEELGLHARPPLRILDLGCGPGYFVTVCQALGHNACGFDLDENPIFRDLVAAQGVRRITGRIEAGLPVPVDAKEGPFDLITAFAICFNNHHSEPLWGVKEWHGFLSDCATRLLSPGGEIVLKFNPKGSAAGYERFFSPDLRGFFLRCRARISGPVVCLRRENIPGS
ncbi:MAG: hypothetical protein Fur0032_16040 [Terrimicrobiaceae bacterium]